MIEKRRVFRDGEQEAIVDRWKPKMYGITFWDRGLYVGSASCYFSEQEAVEALNRLRPSFAEV